MSSAMKVQAVAVFQNQGQRPAQEDHVLANQERGIFIVADGFGGRSGNSAGSAKMACESVQAFLFKEAGDLDATLPFILRTYFSLAGNVLFNSLIHANRVLRKTNHDKSVHEKGGASVVAGYLDGDLLAIASVGDCQAWLIRGGKAAEMVLPRSFSRMTDPFAVDLDDRLRAPLMALGMAEDLEPEIVEYRVRKNDWVIFCTDGIPLRLKKEISLIQQKQFNTNQSIQEFHKLLDQLSFSDNAAISLIIF